MTTATGLLAVWMQIPEASEPDLNAWYTQEHLPERINCAGFQTALRYRSISGEPKYMALYDLDTPQVLYSDAYKALQTGATEWTRRIGRTLERNIRHEYELMQTIGEAPVAAGVERRDDTPRGLSQRTRSSSGCRSASCRRSRRCRACSGHGAIASLRASRGSWSTWS